MLNIYVNFDFEKKFNLKHLVIIPGGHGIGINIYACQNNLEMVIYVLKSAL